MIRSAIVDDAKQIAKVRIDTWRTAYKGMLSEEYLNSMDYEEREKKFRKFLEENNQNKFINVYEDVKTNEVVGFIWFGIPREDLEFDSEIYALYVYDSFQKQGIGKQLINFAIGKFKEMGREKMILWAIKENLNARKFYERMGGKLTKEKVNSINGQDVNECAYAFDLI